MTQKLLQDIEDNIDIRKNLIELKSLIKESEKSGEDVIHTLKKELNNDYTLFLDLLKHEDAKVRKNSALILGEIGDVQFLPYLFDAYMNEIQLYVKSSYLKAISYIDYRTYLPQIKQRREELMKTEFTDENKKHVSEELHILADLVHSIEGFKKHEFCGYQEVSEAVLLTNRNHIHATYDEVQQMKQTMVKTFNAGVMIKTKSLRDVLNIRTYKEILFCVDGMRVLPNDPVQAAKQIAESELKEFLIKRHTDDTPFYFRIELKSKGDLDKRSKFTRKLSAEIENFTGLWLNNSISNYEIEIRLVENKDGNFNTLVKLYTIEDQRFDYRKKLVPSAISPVNAALTLQLVKEHLTEGAQVLDPFCGCGTMLIERKKILETGSLYGTEIYGDAIKAARENTKSAGYEINYINRDFFDFKHEYLFDEIITDMPFSINKKEIKELEVLYQRFFSKASSHLKDQGIMVVYTHNIDLFKRYYKQSSFKVLKEFEISMREGTYVFLLKYEK